MMKQLIHSASLVKHGSLENSPFIDEFLIKTSINWEFPYIFSLNFELTDIRESSQRHGQELISGGANPFVKNEVLMSQLSQLHFQNSGELLFYHSFLGTVSLSLYIYIHTYTYVYTHSCLDTCMICTIIIYK